MVRVNYKVRNIWFLSPPPSLKTIEKYKKICKTLIRSRFYGKYWCAHKTATFTSIQHTVPHPFGMRDLQVTHWAIWTLPPTPHVHILATMPLSTTSPGVNHFHQMAPTQVLTGFRPAQPFWKYVMENNRHTKEQWYSVTKIVRTYLHCFGSSKSFHWQITQKAVHQITDPENKKCSHW